MLLSIQSLRVERAGRLVLSDLSFTLDAGETVFVTGRNGTGKSTLLRTLAGLLPVEAGTIAVSRASDDERGVETMHYLGYEDALKPTMTVRENLVFWAAMLPRPDAPRDFSAGALPPEAALSMFGLARLIDLPAAYLSAGQKRRVALARLLLNPRPIWLLDEPLIALDAQAQDILVSVMADHTARGGGIIAASHVPLGLRGRGIDLDGRG